MLPSQYFALIAGKTIVMVTVKDDAILERIHNPSFLHVLSPASLKHMAREWLKEDVPSFDYAGFVVGEKEEQAIILQKESGVLAGQPFVDAVFKELDCLIEWHVTEGSYVEPIKKVATVSGKVRHLLLGERVALNCLTRASGIATAARRMAHIADKCGWKGEVAGTRKTTPGFRLVEKYALLVGGVSTHRHDLSSMIMLKDNHIWTAGNITQVGLLEDLYLFCNLLLSLNIPVYYNYSAHHLFRHHLHQLFFLYISILFQVRNFPLFAVYNYNSLYQHSLSSFLLYRHQ